MASVLIVEDDPDVRDALAELLQLREHDVWTARDGAEGLRNLAHRRPDLVLLDVEMPILDGPQMALQMFLHDVGLESIPIVLVSGTMDLERVARVVGTPYFLAKPCHPLRLVALVERALAERTAPHPAVT